MSESRGVRIRILVLSALALAGSAIVESSPARIVMVRPAGTRGPLPIWRKGKWGYADPTGKIIIAPQFDNAYFFAEGLAPVQTGEKFGYIDESGGFAIEPRFAGAGPFSEGLAPVSENKGQAYIDKSGKVVFKIPHNAYAGFSEGLLKVNLEVAWRCVGADGKFVPAPEGCFPRIYHGSVLDAYDRNSV